MSKHNTPPAPVPAGNRPAKGPAADPADENETAPEGAPFNDQDPKRRLGDFTGAGEHSIQQPNGKQGSK